MASRAWPDMRRVAQGAAEAGARILVTRFGDARADQEKGAGDYVSAVDRESEEIVVARLREATPGTPVLAEEGGGVHDADRYWVVDPLDGTTNYLIGFPAACVAVALVEEGRPVAAAVCAPLLGLTFSAARGHGATSGGRPIRVSARPPERAIVATALPFRAPDRLRAYLPAMERVFRATEDLRRVGSAELDLAWVAAGVWDGYFELNLRVWDVAAGALLIEEAGGVVTDWQGGPDYLAGDVVAGSPATHAVLLEAIGAEAG